MGTKAMITLFDRDNKLMSIVTQFDGNPEVVLSEIIKHHTSMKENHTAFLHDPEVFAAQFLAGMVADRGTAVYVVPNTLAGAVNWTYDLRNDGNGWVVTGRPAGSNGEGNSLEEIPVTELAEWMADYL